MKITQEESFKPVVITLTTREEADAFWGIVCDQEESEDVRKLKTRISDWFTNNYR